MKALKEWATVITALENGDQTVLLRKGGILETASGFKVEEKKFLLYPTFEHQDNASLKSQFYRYLADVREQKPKEGTSRITSYAEVLAQADVSSMQKIEELSDFHIWSDSYMVERMNWLPQKPMTAIFLKIYKIPSTQIQVLQEYEGCKSWIDINVNIDPGEAVLNETDLQQRLSQFRRILS